MVPIFEISSDSTDSTNLVNLHFLHFCKIKDILVIGAYWCTYVKYLTLSSRENGA